MVKYGGISSESTKNHEIKGFNVTLYIITPIGVDEIRSLSAVWNQHEVMYGINPKEKYTLTRDAIRLRRLHTHLR